MQIIRPIEVTPARLVDSNVPITEIAWAAGSHAKGTRRYVGTILYEVVAATSTTDEPTVGAAKDPPTWARIGAINRFRMFDRVVGDPTTNPGTIEVEIVPGAGHLVDSLAVFGIVGQTLTITVTEPDNTQIFSRTIELVDLSEISNWWAFYFLPIDQRTQYLELELPPVSIGTIKVTIDGGEGEASCGELVLGRLRRIGETLVGVRTGIRDFSRKEQNEFGGWAVVKRSYSRRAEFPVFLDNYAVAGVSQFLADIRTVPAVFIGATEFESTVVYGYYRDFSVMFSSPVASEISLEVEGLT